jgi:hypothetical protein
MLEEGKERRWFEKVENVETGRRREEENGGREGKKE